MNWKSIKSDKDLETVFNLFDGGAKLVSINYVACDNNSETNNVRSAELRFIGKRAFVLKFIGIDCLHVAPISKGRIMVENVALGKFRNLYFWADDGSFNITMPDTSLSYVIASELQLGL